MSALGQKQYAGGAKHHVRFSPISDRKSGHAAMVMSALHLKADMYVHVCFGPIADIPRSFDDAVEQITHG